MGDGESSLTGRAFPLDGLLVVSEYVLGAKCGSEILAEYINNLHKGPNE